MPNRRILYVQFTNPAGYPPLEHSSQLLANLGWQVMFLGTGALGADSLRFPFHPGIEVRRMPFRKPGWRQKFGFLAYIMWVVGHVARWRPGWIYASDLFACPVALLLTYLPGIRVIYHEHDSPVDGAQSQFIRWLKWTRRRLAHRARLCILPSQRRADYFQHELQVSRPPLVVWNCPRRREAECRSSTDSDSMWVLYNGSIVPSRLPNTVLEALTLLPAAVRLRIVGYETIGARGYVSRLKRYAEEAGISDRVEFVGSVPTRQELIGLAAQSQVGLSLFALEGSDWNERTMVGPSNKPFGYLACGLPLVVSDWPEWKETFVTPGYGFACDPGNAQSIAGVLHWYWDHPKEREEMGNAGRQRILTEWNYETQFEAILRTLDSEQHQE